MRKATLTTLAARVAATVVRSPDGGGGAMVVGAVRAGLVALALFVPRPAATAAAKRPSFAIHFTSGTLS